MNYQATINSTMTQGDFRVENHMLQSHVCSQADTQGSLRSLRSSNMILPFMFCDRCFYCITALDTISNQFYEPKCLKPD